MDHWSEEPDDTRQEPSKGSSANIRRNPYRLPGFSCLMFIPEANLSLPLTTSLPSTTPSGLTNTIDQRHSAKMRLPIFTILFAVFCNVADSFEVLPYVHIDFAFYFRLAQCQAKCTEKYGSVANRELLDGTERRFFNISSDEYQWCDRGCSHGRIFTKKQSRGASTTSTAFKDGQTFWLNSATDNGTQGASPIEAIDVICVNPSMTDVDSGFVDSLSAKLVARTKPDFVAPIKYIVQWKQMTLIRGGVTDETKWITAAIEDSPLLVAEQLQPGIFYQFLITAVGPVGRLGAAVASDWLQAPSLATSAQPNTGLSAKSQFNSDDGIGAMLSWPKIRSTPLSTPVPSVLSAYKILPSLTSCHFQVLLFNSTSTWTDVFEKDDGNGYLLRNLAFSSDYSISIRTFVPGDSEVLSKIDKWPLQIDYRSVSCQDVYGKGSLECDPEPVSHLSVLLHPKNASATINWRPAVDHAQILLYQLVYTPIPNKDGTCALDQTSVYLPATTTTTTILLPTTIYACNYEVKVVTYDLIGREALAAAVFRYEPPTPIPFNGTYAQLWVVAIPAAALLLLCALVNCAKCCHRRSKKISGVDQKILAESV
uniref:Fibronectin type-III domain-containing protein n=1 Tax=Panagrellus redivivus TaxID=6233 RepID=A0A7E4V7G0_PANRE